MLNVSYFGTWSRFGVSRSTDGNDNIKRNSYKEGCPLLNADGVWSSRLRGGGRDQISQKDRLHFIEQQTIKLSPIETDGIILDIGGGGEGINQEKKVTSRVS